MRRSIPLCLVLAMSACGARKGQERAAAPPNEIWLSAAQARQADYEVAPVAEGTVGGTVRTVGRLAFDDQRVTHLFSPVSGRVTRLLADLGQRVKPGQALAVIDSPDLGGALSDYHKAQAGFVAAEKEFRRQNELFEGHAGAERDLDSAEAIYRNALAERDRARQRAELLCGGDLAQVGQGYQLRSPIAGEVIARMTNPGAELNGQYGGGSAAELFTIGELDRLWLLADVAEMDIAKVRVGSRVTFEVQGQPGPARTGVVNWVAGSLDPVTRTARIRCEVPNPGRSLKPEMFAQVSIQVGGRRALAIPRSALVRMGDLTYALVDLGPLADGGHRFERRPIQAEERESGDLLPVLSGLRAGEKVVTRGVLLLGGAG